MTVWSQNQWFYYVIVRLPVSPYYCLLMTSKCGVNRLQFKIVENFFTERTQIIKNVLYSLFIKWIGLVLVLLLLGLAVWFYYGVSAPDWASSIWDFFETGDHTDWEKAPSSCDLQSWFEWSFEKYLPPWNTLSNCPSANNCQPYWNPYRKCRKKWTWFLFIPKYESGWDRFGNYEISSLYHCRRRHK